MAGKTRYHMTPAGLMRCRHGQGGVSGKSRACPYGGPVTSSSERMSVPLSERPRVGSLADEAMAPSSGKVVSKQDQRHAALWAELQELYATASHEDGSGSDHFSSRVLHWAMDNGVCFIRISGEEYDFHHAARDNAVELGVLLRHASKFGLPDMLTEDEVPAFLEEARKTLPQTEEEFVTALPAAPFWQDTSTVDEEALLKKFRNKTSQGKDVLTPQEVYWLASQSSSPQAKRILGYMEEEKADFVKRARKAWHWGGWIEKWKLFLNGEHHYPLKPVKPRQVWGMLSVEQTWILTAEGVDVPDYVE